MVYTIPVPIDLDNIVRQYLMPAARDIALRRMRVHDQIRVIRTLVLDGERVPVRDLITFIDMWQWRPILRRS